MSADDLLAAVSDWKSRIGEVQLYGDYYKGRHRIGQYATKAFRRDFQWILENSRENLCKAVVRGFSSKMVIAGWDGTGADLAGDLTKELQLGRVFNLTHREMYRTGDGYVLVWPDANNVVRPWPKLSRQVAVRTVAGDPDRLEWLALLWVNDDGNGRVNLYYADRLERWVTVAKLKQPSDSRLPSFVTWPEKTSSWQQFNGDDGGHTITHDFGRVPAVWLPHDADELGGHGVSILEDVVPLQDALNKSVADLIVGGENFAQPLRYILNMRAKRRINPETGAPQEESIRADPTVNKFLTLPGDGPIGQLDPPDATKLLAVHEAYANKISRVTGLPAFYVSPISGEPPTGVALRVLSTRLTDLARETQEDSGPKWAELMEMLGVPEVEPIWKDPAPIDQTEELENAEARKSIGYGFGEILKKLGEDEEDIKRIVEDARGNQPSGGQLAARSFEAGVDPADLVG